MAEVASLPDLREIVGRLGGDLYNGGRAASVPGPGHSPKDRSLSLRLTDDGRLLWCSHADDPAEVVWAYLGLPRDAAPRMDRREAERARQERQRAAKAERARKLAFCEKAWSATQAADGSPVAAYLRGRGITGPIPNALRFHPAAPMDYDARTTQPAMVAIVTGPDGRQACGLHVTAILPDGSGKATLSNPRRMFGDIAGGVVQLTPLPADGELAISEGVETALSYRDLTGTPTWAGLSTSGLSRFNPPLGLRRLVIAADGDPAGLRAAQDLAERASRRCECVVMPAPAGADWNDVAMGAAQ